MIRFTRFRSRKVPQDGLGVREVCAYGHAADAFELACVARVAFDGAMDAGADSVSVYRWTRIPADGDESTQHWISVVATWQVPR